MKRFSLMLACAASGCATTGSLQQKAASYTLTSSRSAAAIEECLSLKLSKLGAPSAIRGEGRIVLPYGQPNPAFTLTIIDGGAQRSVEGRSGIASAGSVRRDVETCL